MDESIEDKNRIYRSPTKIFKSKRAQSPESQFNWIFILIVGALLIAFFTMIIIKQKGASDVKVSGVMTKQLSTVFSGARVSSGTVQEIPIPKTDIRFACNDYYIGAASQRFGNRLVFAPEHLSGIKIQTWTLDWNTPYKVTTFLYVTGPRIQYVLVDNGDFDMVRKLNLSLPVKLNRNFDHIKYGGPEYFALKKSIGDHTRFIFVGNVDTPSQIPPAFEGDISALMISTGTKDLRFYSGTGGSLTELTQSTGPIPYLDFESLLGAVFTDDPGMYTCVIDRAWGTWNLVNQIFIKKFNDIAPIYEGTSCGGFYKDNYDLGTIRQITDHGFNQNSAATDIDSLSAALVTLGQTNERVQLSSCPLLY